MADLLATSPFVNPGLGYQARRMVLSVIRRPEDGSPVEFVVQQQCIDEDGKSTLQDGNWMPIFDRDPDDVYREAWNRFMERVAEEARFPLADLDAERFIPYRRSLTINTGKG